jgi:hypothetical protein
VVKVAPSSGRDLQEDLPDGSAAASGQEDGFAAYSTALSVTVAIGEFSELESRVRYFFSRLYGRISTPRAVSFSVQP